MSVRTEVRLIYGFPVDKSIGEDLYNHIRSEGFADRYEKAVNDGELKNFVIHSDMGDARYVGIRLATYDEYNQHFDGDYIVRDDNLTQTIAANLMEIEKFRSLLHHDLQLTFNPKMALIFAMLNS